MAKTDGVQIFYDPRPDADPEKEITVLASVYSFVVGCAEMRQSREKKKGGCPTKDSRQDQPPATREVYPHDTRS